jgi:hypothetical protein
MGILALSDIVKAECRRATLAEDAVLMSPGEDSGGRDEVGGSPDIKIGVQW